MQNIILKKYAINFPIYRLTIYNSAEYIVVISCKKNLNKTPEETNCHSVSFWNLKSLYIACSLSFSFGVPLAVIHCHSLSFAVTLCHLLYHSLSFIVTGCTTRFHFLSFVVTRCATGLYFHKQSKHFLKMFKSNTWNFQ